jgi:hypothetical protein
MVALAEPDSGETVNSYVSQERGPTRILYPASQAEETDQTTKQKKAASRELGQIIYMQPNAPLVISTGWRAGYSSEQERESVESDFDPIFLFCIY